MSSYRRYQLDGKGIKCETKVSNVGQRYQLLNRRPASVGLTVLKKETSSCSDAAPSASPIFSVG